MKRQQGMTLTGLIGALIVLCMVALLGFKLFDPYSQYFTIKKTFKVLAENPEFRGGNRREILDAYQKYAMIDSITAVKDEDIEITRAGGSLVLSASYSVKVPLAYNISLLIDFAPSSAAR